MYSNTRCFGRRRWGWQVQHWSTSPFTLSSSNILNRCKTPICIILPVKEGVFSFLCEYSADIPLSEMNCSQPQVSMWQCKILAVVLTASFSTSSSFLSHLHVCLCARVFHSGRRRKIHHLFGYLHILACRFLLPAIFNWPTVKIGDVMGPETFVVSALVFFSVLTKGMNWFHRKNIPGKDDYFSYCTVLNNCIRNMQIPFLVGCSSPSVLTVSRVRLSKTFASIWVSSFAANLYQKQKEAAFLWKQENLHKAS